MLFFFIEAHEPMHGQDDIEQLHPVAGERMNSTFCRFSSLRNAISLFVKIRFSGTEETPLQAVDRLFFEEKKRVTDIVSVHRRVAPGDPFGRLERFGNALSSYVLTRKGFRDRPPQRRLECRVSVTAAISVFYMFHMEDDHAVLGMI
jgi:hypothetical protein